MIAGSTLVATPKKGSDKGPQTGILEPQVALMVIEFIELYLPSLLLRYFQSVSVCSERMGRHVWVMG
jgi:hypothetical protein